MYVCRGRVVEVEVKVFLTSLTRLVVAWFEVSYAELTIEAEMGRSSIDDWGRGLETRYREEDEILLKSAGGKSSGLNNALFRGIVRVAVKWLEVEVSGRRWL